LQVQNSSFQKISISISLLFLLLSLTQCKADSVWGMSQSAFLERLARQENDFLADLEIKDGNLIGPKRSEMKKYDELKNNLENINRLFEQIDETYSGSIQKIMTDEKDKIEQQLRDMDQAKRYLAYQLSEEINRLEAEKTRINPERVKEARETIRFYQKKQRDLKQKHTEQKESEKKSQHYDWLKKAKEVYNEQLVQSSFKPNPIFFILALVTAGLSLVCLYFRITIGSAIGIGCTILFGFLYIKKIQVGAEQSLKNEELNKLADEFKNRFDQENVEIPFPYTNVVLKERS